MSYRYETHMHTAECSRCARATAEEQVRFYKGMGFDGICVTDHFLGGNTPAPPELSWRKKIELFCPNDTCAEKLAQINRIAQDFGGDNVAELTLTDYMSRVWQECMRDPEKHIVTGKKPNRSK